MRYSVPSKFEVPVPAAITTLAHELEARTSNKKYSAYVDYT